MLKSNYILLLMPPNMIKLDNWHQQSLFDRLSWIEDIQRVNYQSDVLFIAKLILRDFDICYDSELIKILNYPDLWSPFEEDSIKEYVATQLPQISFEEIIKFLWEKNLTLLKYLHKKVLPVPFEKIYPYFQSTSPEIFSDLAAISLPIDKVSDEVEKILLDPDIELVIRYEIYLKLTLTDVSDQSNLVSKLPNDLSQVIERSSNSQNLSTTSSKKIEIDDTYKNNLWDIEIDDNKKAVVFYLRYERSVDNFKNVIKKIIDKLKFEIKSWNSWFEQIVLTFRYPDQYDNSLSDLIEDWNDIIKFAFVEWDTFQSLINSPNRSVIHLMDWTPEELLDRGNGTSMINKKTISRFNFQKYWINDFISLPWSANEPKQMEDDYYVDTFINSFKSLPLHGTNQITELIQTIISSSKNINKN